MKKPEKTAIKNILVRLPEEVAKDVEQRAKENQRSVNAQIVFELKQNK